MTGSESWSWSVSKGYNTMAKAMDCDRCGKRFLAEPKETLCIMCCADYDHEQREDSDDEDPGELSDRDDES
jgi:hypothetical protein